MAGAVTSLHITNDGRLILFGAHWPSQEQYTVWHYFRQESKDSGHTWTNPEPVVIHDNHACIGCPVPLSNGELLFPASYFQKRPRPLSGPAAKLAQAKTEEEALAIPPSKNDEGGGKLSTHLHGCSVLIAGNENATQLTEHGTISNRPLGLLEPTCVQLKNGHIAMLMRAEFGGYLWRSESSDNGRTWTQAWQTDIPNPTSLASLIRLSDGRIALLHNPTGGEIGARSPRDPLSIWISTDELQTWTIKEDVIHGGSLAYPHPTILDGGLVFAYDHNRRQIRYVETRIPD
jgi:predicted neuraminidase